MLLLTSRVIPIWLDVLGGGERPFTAIGLCCSPHLTFTGDDVREGFALATTLSPGSIRVFILLVAILACGRGGDGVGDCEGSRDGLDDSNRLDEFDVGDDGRYRFAGKF